MSSVAPTAPAVSTTPGYHPTLLLVGRILLAAIFLIAGSRKVMTYAATVGYFTKLGFPMPEVMAVWEPMGDYTDEMEFLALSPADLG